MEKQFGIAELPFRNNGIVGNSPVMKTLDCQIATAARSDLTVLITGESGTGKELVARAIHTASSRANSPFISINCGAISESLLESELFGYERGAFTGADLPRKGLFEAAQQGTIFLDEIGEMSISCQVKLLRVLQESTVRPVGAHSEIPVNVRVVTATNRNLPQQITLGRFRQDLFYRIAVLTITTPPLRDRASDIPVLVEYFLRKAAKEMNRDKTPGITSDAIAALCRYTWPGNVRQLQHVIQRLVAGLTNGRRIYDDEVNQALQDMSSFDVGPQVPMIFLPDDSLDGYMDRVLLGLYNHFRALTGSHAEAARMLRIDRIALYSRLRRAKARANGNGNGSTLDEDWSD